MHHGVTTIPSLLIECIGILVCFRMCGVTDTVSLAVSVSEVAISTKNDDHVIHSDAGHQMQDSERFTQQFAAGQALLPDTFFDWQLLADCQNHMCTLLSEFISQSIESMHSLCHTSHFAISILERRPCGAVW